MFDKELKETAEELINSYCSLHGDRHKKVLSETLNGFLQLMGLKTFIRVAKKMVESVRSKK